jgi:hypothetical protein
LGRRLEVSAAKAIKAPSIGIFQPNFELSEGMRGNEARLRSMLR